MYKRNLQGCYFYLKISTRRLPFRRPHDKSVRLKRTIDIMFRVAFPQNLYYSEFFDAVRFVLWQLR